MTSSKFAVLSVDDDESNQRLIESALEDEYQLYFAYNGETALDIVQKESLDLILLDVEMPGIDGFEVCHTLRATHSTDNLPVVFLSALDMLESKLMGYEVGGNDYIAKPIEMAELLSKLEFLLKQKKSVSKLKSSLDKKKKTAFSSMNENAELGIIIRFMQASFSCYSQDALSEAIFSACKDLGLSTSVQFRLGSTVDTFSSTGAINPLEEQLLTKAAAAQRIISLNQKALFNSQEISILVKNMPTEQEELCGRYRDHLAIILDGAQAQCEVIKLKNEQKNSRNQKISVASQSITDDIIFLQGQFLNYCISIESSYEDFKIDFDEAAAIAGLSNDQQATLMESMDRMLDNVDKFSNQKDVVNHKIAEITAALLGIMED